MKQLTLFLIPFILCAESNSSYYQDDNLQSARDPIIELMSEINLGNSDIAWEKCHEQYTANSNLIRDKFLLPYLEYQSKLIQNNKELLEIEFKLKKEKLKAEEKLHKIEMKFKEREAQIAEHFNASRTGKINGVSWFDLSEDQKQYYRENLYNNQQK